MNEAQIASRKRNAGEKHPSMKRRSEQHDYHSRRFYMLTLVVEGRRPVLGRLVVPPPQASAPSPSQAPGVPFMSVSPSPSHAFAPSPSPFAAAVPQPSAPQQECQGAYISLSPLGQAVETAWNAISTHCPEVAVVALQVMPDHIHGILFFRKETPSHLGQVINGFKIATRRALQTLQAAAPSPQTPAPSPYAAAVPQPLPSIWEAGYNDKILHSFGELDRWKAYLEDNPRRLAMRRAHPDLFRVRFGLRLGEQDYAAIGNRFLLSRPWKVRVQLSRRLTDAEIGEAVERHLALAKNGALLVSPAISKGEQAVMRAALDGGLPLIFLTPWGFNAFSKPGHQYFEACADGRLLLLAPWPHQNERIPLTRQMCLDLNAMAADICRPRHCRGVQEGGNEGEKGR